MKRFLQFLTIAVLVLAASVVLADQAPVAMTGDQLASQVLAQLPPWLQWIIGALATLCGPAILAFIKSERMALDSSTAANGVWHYFKLAKAALAILPNVPDVPDDPDADPLLATQQAAPPMPDANAAQIAALEAQLAALKGGAANA